jgi:predicted outer membrane lipoprotein
MRHVVKLIALALVLALALLLAVVAGDYGPWYFAWLVGTTMIVLIAVSGAVLFETQVVARDGRRDEL